MIAIYLKYFFTMIVFLMNFLFLMWAIAVCSFSAEVFLLFTWYHYLVLELPVLLLSPVLKCWPCRHLNCKTYCWPGAQSTTWTFWRTIEHDTFTSLSHCSFPSFSQQALGISDIPTYEKFKALSESLEKLIKNETFS